MSRGLRWISREAAVAMHTELITRYGGSPGLRDAGLLSSALARPVNVHGYEPEASVARLAAALGWGLAKNHAFLDGNKRIALAAIVVFLEINGHELTCSEAEETDAMLRISASEMKENQWEQWMEANVRSKPTQGHRA